MAQRNRFDGPGIRHHVMNRGMGKRLLFAGRRDHRQWLARLGCASRRGEIEPEAFTLMGTHFHLMARSEQGTISYAMMRIQNGYARWFNRRNRRDGTPSRGRFRSKPVVGETYFKTLVRYIDHNPVRADLCTHPGHYPWGSARYYLGDRSPPWLSRAAIDRFVARRLRDGETREQAYGRIFCAPFSAFELEFLRRRAAQPGSPHDDLDYLREAPGQRALPWIEDKARNADGFKPALALAAPGAVEASIAALTESHGAFRLQITRTSWDGWQLLRIGLFWGVAGLSMEAIARRLAISPSKAGRCVRIHRERLVHDGEYRARAATIVAAALSATFG